MIDHKKSKVLLTCFIANLSDLYSFKRACADFGSNNNLHIMTFHKLAKKIYDEILHLSYEGDFPNDDEISRLLDYIKNGKVNLRFLAVFIDEVQIFNPLYLEVCYSLLEEHPDSVFLLAGDLNQSVRIASRRGYAPWKRMKDKEKSTQLNNHCKQTICNSVHANSKFDNNRKSRCLWDEMILYNSQKTQTKRL